MSNLPLLRYRLSMERPHRHLFEVSLEAQAPGGSVDLALPAWAPGAYKILDNARNLRGLKATGPDGQPLLVERVDFHTWRVHHGGSPFKVTYQVFANKLQIHQAQLTAQHALVNGAVLFLYPVGGQEWPCELTLTLPEGWDVSTSLRKIASDTYEAPTYDDLIDGPIQAGTFERAEFEAAGVRHEIAWTAPYAMDRAKVVDGLTRIVEAEAEFWGGLPYDRYVLHYQHGPESFLNGLEHKQSMVIVGPMNLQERARSFFALTAHEVFHAWNIKRLRPVGLGPFDYRKHAHTTALWVVEGLTEYYTERMVLKAGLITPAEYLQGIAENLVALEHSPGRKFTTLEEASYITWNFGDDRWNGAVNYYLKGSLVGVALDLEIRHLTGNARSLDDVMRLLWERYGEPEVPYHPSDVEAVASEVAGTSLEAFFDFHLRTTEDPDWQAIFAKAGLRLVVSSRVASLQARTSPKDGGWLIEDVRAGGAAQEAGLMAGDLLLAIANRRIASDVLSRYQPDETAVIRFMRDDRMRETTVRLGADQTYALEPLAGASGLPGAIASSWLGLGAALEAVV